jgi:hypothetical protein
MPNIQAQISHPASGREVIDSPIDALERITEILSPVEQRGIERSFKSLSAEKAPHLLTGRTNTREPLDTIEKAIQRGLLNAWVSQFDKSLALHSDIVTDARETTTARGQSPHDILCMVASGVLRYLGFDEVAIGDKVSKYPGGQGDVIGHPGPAVAEVGNLSDIRKPVSAFTISNQGSLKILSPNDAVEYYLHIPYPDDKESLLEPLPQSIPVYLLSRGENWKTANR